MSMDWESLYELASNIDTAAIIIIYAASFAYFCAPFVKFKKHALAAGAAYFAALVAMHRLPFIIGNVIVYSVSSLVGLLALYIFDRRRILQKIFLGVTFFCVRWLVAASGNCLYIWLDKMSVNLPDYSGNIELQFALFAGFCAVTVLADAVLLFGISGFIGKVYRYKEESMSGSEFALMFLPSISSLVGYAMMKFYDSNYKADTGYMLSEISTRFNLMCLVYYAASLATIAVVIVLYQSIKEKQDEAKRNALLNSQIENIRHHIDRVEHLYADVRGLRHDMGNHIATLETLYETGESAAANEYMKAFRRTLESTDSTIKSGNPVTDIILSERRQEAEEKGISFACSFSYPDGGNINAFDISVILNNALDNAIRVAHVLAEAGKDAYIDVRSYKRNEVYMIDITNNCSNKLRAERDRDAGNGYGLLNIKKVAQKYCGDMTAECKGGVFRLSVMLVNGDAG